VIDRRIRLLLLDDHRMFVESIAGYLERDPGFEIAAKCSTLGESMAAVRAGRVDVVLLDLDLGGENGCDFLLHASEAGFSGRVLVLTGLTEMLHIQRALRYGAAGVCLKTAPVEELSRTIRQVHAGLESRGVPAQPRRAPLTARDLCILSLVREGVSNKELAARLGTSETAIKAGLQRLFHKFGVRTRVQLATAAIRYEPGSTTVPGTLPGI
jgi:DNA-binding NarL/FixJ family response regulator